jgi:hypothetical protein
MEETGPLAYVFWHWKRGHVETAAYESRLRAFHTALAGAAPASFRRSFSFAVTRAPWLGVGDAAYEDWYLLDHYAALGVLTRAAVEGVSRSGHDAAAALMAGGTAGLYRLREGEALLAPSHACWFEKPEGSSYDELLAELRPMVEETSGALWVRQLALGPAREFCLHATTTLAVPDRLRPHHIPLRRVWPATSRVRRGSGAHGQEVGGPQVQ